MRTFILEAKAPKDKIRGTVFLKNDSDVGAEDCNLKKLEGTSIILNPQPSDSASDPYNWSTKRKNVYFATLLFSSIGASVLGQIVSPAITQISSELNVSLSSGIQINGVLVMALGVSAYICGQISSIIGKRLLFLITNFGQVLFCIWAANSKTYGSLIASRIFMGGSMGMTYSVAGTGSISDVFFVHERGRYVSIWSFLILSVNSITPIVSGYLIQSLSWKWVFGFAAIMFFIAFVSSTLLLPETGFKRDVDIRLKSDNKPDERILVKDSDSISVKEIETYRFKDSLKLYNGRLTDESVINVLLRPFILASNPIIIWGTLQWCFCYLWVIVISTISSQVFTKSPYNFTVSQTGLISGIPPLIGTLIGTLISGILSDFIAGFISKRNNGIYESEFRLFMMIPYIACTVIGSFGLGFSIHDGKPWMIVAVYLGVLFTGVAFGCNAIISYTVDTLNELSGEAFGIMMLGRSCFVFGLLFVISNWYANHGPISLFCICGALTGGIGFLSIPMYIFGKKSRATL